MSGKTRQFQLATDIARVLGSKNTGSASTLGSRYLLMAGIATAIMQTQSAGAVSLGELRVQSAVGQPFVASTTARIGPGESLSSTCITAPAGGNDLGSPAGLQVTTQSANTPGSYPVQVRSTQPLYEPMYEIRLQINCPGEVALSKNYVVMLNLPMQAPVESTAIAAENPTAPATVTASASSATQQRQTRRRNNNRNGTGQLAPNRGSITAGGAYRIRSGDTLSTIAQRIDGRPAGTIWRVAEMLYSSNPDAFIRGNRNMIKMGWVLDIPSVAEMTDGSLSATRNSRAIETPVNEPPAIASNTQINTVPGRPEDEVVENIELLNKIRETNLAAISAQTENPMSPVTADPIPAIDSNNAEPAAINTAELSPFADEAVETGRETPVAARTPDVAQDNLGQVAAAEDKANMNPLLAVLAGVAMGMFLALLILGRKIITPLLEGRARREAARAPAPAPEKPSPRKQVFTTMEAGTKPATTTYGGSGIDVEISEGEPESALTASTADSTPEELPQTPRVNLHKQENNLHSSDALDGTGTMRSLFDENHPLQNVEGSDAESFAGDTAELPELEQSTFSNAESDNLDTLNSALQIGSGDEELSATLVEALGLLEQDYEDELTASQVLNKREVESALSDDKKS